MTRVDFIQAHSPIYMYRYAREEERCHLGASPIIAVAAHLYGDDAMSDIITALLVDFAQFNGSQQLTVAQIGEVCQCIITQFPRLRVSELVLFFVKCKAGKYGKFWNHIYPMDITTHLHSWFHECQEYTRVAHQRQQQEQLERDRESMYNNPKKATADDLDAVLSRVRNRSRSGKVLRMGDIIL